MRTNLTNDDHLNVIHQTNHCNLNLLSPIKVLLDNTKRHFSILNIAVQPVVPWEVDMVPACSLSVHVLLRY